MLVVLPFHAGDKAQAVILANWIRELGQVSEDKCLIALGSGCGETDVIEPLLECFGSVSVFRAEVRKPGEGQLGYWRASNAMWQSVAWKIHFQDKCPWLWLEPDAIPTRPTWLREIKEEYLTHKKPFMGFKSVKKDQAWINGVAVYPASVCDHAPLALQAGECAWDLNAGSQMVQHAHVSNLFQHVYLIDGQAPTFPKDNDRLNNAALFHRCKDGTLITFLKEHGYTKALEHIKHEEEQLQNAGASRGVGTTGGATAVKDDSEEMGESVDYAQRLLEEQRRHPVRPQKPKEGERFGELIWRGGKWHTSTDVVEAPKADRKVVMEKYKHPETILPVPVLAEPLDRASLGAKTESGEARESTDNVGENQRPRGGQNDLLQSKGEGNKVHHGPPEAKKEPEEPGSPSPLLQTENVFAIPRDELVKEAVAVLKQLCTSPYATGQVRKELKKQKVTK